MSRSHEQTASFPYPYAVVLDAAVRALPPAGFSVSAVDPAQGYLAASTSLSMTSWGEKITVRLGQVAADAPTVVQVRSSLVGPGLVDYGRNRKHVEKLLGALGAFLDQYAAAARLPG